MISVNQLQSPSALSQLLGLQPSMQSSTSATTQANASQAAGLDSLSISSAALQALQGLGLDASQTQPDPASATYTARGHHHHHRGSALAQQGTTAQAGSSGTSTQVPLVGQADGTTGGS